MDFTHDDLTGLFLLHFPAREDTRGIKEDGSAYNERTDELAEKLAFALEAKEERLTNTPIVDLIDAAGDFITRD